MRRPLAILAVFALLVTACDRGGDSEAITTSTSTSTSTTTTTTVPPTTTTTVPPTPQTAEDAGLHWWNDRVFYEIFVRSFKDSDGDGVGDLRGVIESLDYLNDGDPSTTDDLGVTGIWLMPVFESPSYHGYDVVDYREIEPDYGRIQDLRGLLAAAHERGIAVIVDLVVNHSSRQHEWFQESRDPSSEFADWYIWEDQSPGFIGPWGQTVWHGLDGRYFYGVFWDGMPDLNLENPDVTAELESIASFWLEDVGVDGFRVDAARHLIEDGDDQEDTPQTISWLEGFNGHTDEITSNSLIVGEAWSPTVIVGQYIPGALDLAFEFELSDAILLGIEAGNTSGLRPVLERVMETYPAGQFAPFLANHDQTRVMNRLFNEDRAAAAASILLTLPGVPFLYYGEEIGMNGTKPDERIRTPMPWTGEAPGFDFTTADAPWEPFQPGAEDVNVAAQDGVEGSLLEIYRSLVHLRNGSPALKYGDLQLVDSASGAVLSYLRSIGDDHILVIVNLGRTPTSTIAFDLAESPLDGPVKARALMGRVDGDPDVDPSGGFTGYKPVSELAPYEVLIIQLDEV